VEDLFQSMGRTAVASNQVAEDPIAGLDVRDRAAVADPLVHLDALARALIGVGGKPLEVLAADEIESVAADPLGPSECGETGLPSAPPRLPPAVHEHDVVSPGRAEVAGQLRGGVAVDVGVPDQQAPVRIEHEAELVLVLVRRAEGRRVEQQVLPALSPPVPHHVVAGRSPRVRGVGGATAPLSAAGAPEEIVPAEHLRGRPQNRPRIPRRRVVIVEHGKNMIRLHGVEVHLVGLLDQIDEVPGQGDAPGLRRPDHREHRRGGEHVVAVAQLELESVIAVGEAVDPPEPP